MSEEIQKKRRGRPPGSAKKVSAEQTAVESIIDNDVIESPPAPVPRQAQHHAQRSAARRTVVRF